MNWKEYINEVPDFPKPGVSFKDISPLLKSIRFSEVISEKFKDLNNKIDKLQLYSLD